MRASHWRLRSAWQRNARPASRTESSRLAWFILGRCEPCGDGRVYCWRGWQLRDRPAGHRPTVRRRAERTPLRIGKARRIKRRARIPMRECWWWRSAQDACWRTRPAKRSRNLRTEPRDGSLRRFVSGVKNLLAWLRKIYSVDHAGYPEPAQVGLEGCEI